MSKKKKSYVMPDGRFFRITLLFADLDKKDDATFPSFNNESPFDKVILVDRRLPFWSMFGRIIHEFFHLLVHIFQTSNGKLIIEKKEEARIKSAERVAKRELKIFDSKYRLE